jgi:N6-adenosine-specific RNA methylase IME4
LLALPVQRVAADDCVLFLWTIGPMLEHGMAAMKAFGFKYKTYGFSWMKVREGRVQMGQGYWTRSNLELCILGTRGHPKRIDKGVLQGITEPRREHSRKPDCVPERIERLVGGPYLELFGRERRRGWTVRGDQIGKFKP